MLTSLTFYATILHAALSLCSSDICLKIPFSLANNSSGLPHSATLPSSRTTILSAASTVRILWAITRTVLFASRLDNALWTFVSFSTSSDAVASSSRTIGAFFRSARAIEILCLSPPESLAPFSPILVLYPSGSLLINSSQLAAAAAARTSSRYF